MTTTPRPDWTLLDRWIDSDGFTAAWVNYNKLRGITGMREVIDDFVALEDSDEYTALWNDQARNEQAAMLYGAMLMWAIANGEPPPRTHEIAWIFNDIATHSERIAERFATLPVESGRWLQTARCPDWCARRVRSARRRAGLGGAAAV